MESSPATSEAAWLTYLADVSGWCPPMKPTVVLSPHPDDETLGAGGLIAIQRHRQLPVRVIALTNGEAAYGITPGLGDVRRLEQESALTELGVVSSEIVRLGLPDSNVTSHETQLLELLWQHVGEDSLILAPWPHDPHPDHEACGRAAQKLHGIGGRAVVFYLFWTWHRCEVTSVASLPLVRLNLDDGIQAARARALGHHKSQLQWTYGEPILPELLLAPAQRSFETFLIHG